MITIMQLRKEQADEAKRAAERRKQIATQQRRISQAIKKVGDLMTPGLWTAPEAVTNWIKAEIRKVLNRTESQQKQAKELIEGLEAYIENKKYEADQKSAAEAKKKAAQIGASPGGATGSSKVASV